MAKADPTRDYYGDLGVESSASLADIKKQFKKLALTYHPDRNPGREDEVTARFQQIQSAHEVLIDTAERQRYDNTRMRSNYGGASAFASRAPPASTRGNPYSDYGSSWAPPPSRPAGPGPSTRKPAASGAEKYAKFNVNVPKPSTSSTAYEGSKARAAQFQAWEQMNPSSRTNARAGAGPGKTWSTPKAPPKEHTPQSGREESNSFRHQPPPKAKPGFDEFQSFNTSERKSSATRKGGFAPHTPGPDEPAASKGAYFTTHRPVPNPPLPSRVPKYAASASAAPPKSPVAPEYYQQSNENANNEETDGPGFEARQRMSTPYATHGGEKFNPNINPFESANSANVGRSKSSRARTEFPSQSRHVPRTGSDSNLQSPRDRTSFPSFKSRDAPVNTSPGQSDSSGEYEGGRTKTRTYARPRATKASSATQDQKQPSVAPEADSQRKLNPTSRELFRKWFKEHPGVEPSMDDFRTWSKQDFGAEPTLKNTFSDIPGASAEASNTKNGDETKMYGDPFLDMPQSFSSLRMPPKPKIADFPERPGGAFEVESSWFSRTQKSRFGTFPSTKSTPQSKTPSGASTANPKFSSSSASATSPEGLTNFEAAQRVVLEGMLAGKLANESGPEMQKSFPLDAKSTFDGLSSGGSEKAEMGSPVKNPRSVNPSSHKSTTSRYRPAWPYDQKPRTDSSTATSFSMPITDDMFTTTFPNRSAGEINTKFAAEDWDGKFEGSDVFVPPRRNRTTSSSRSSRPSTRGRSPVKAAAGGFPVRETASADANVFSPPAHDGPDPSPVGGKFMPEAWKETFTSPIAFAPPPSPTRGSAYRKTRGFKQTNGTTAMFVSSDESGSEGSSLHKKRPTHTATPEPMDIDTPSAEQPTAVPKANEKLKISTEPPKRPASSPADTEALNIGFDDLHIADLISQLNLPPAPKAPILKFSENERIMGTLRKNWVADFATYMKNWDEFEKRMGLHLFARKNQNDQLGSLRFVSAQRIKEYTAGLKTDAAVMNHWTAALQKHEKNMFDYAATATTNGIFARGESPRKKAH